MPWRVEFAPEKSIVVVAAWGEIRNEDAEAQVEKIILLLKQNQASGVLLDYSDALSEVSLPSLYGLPDYYTELGAPWHARVAVVLPRNRYRIESYQFFELVCKNAGYNVRLFDGRGAAEAWLAEMPRPQHHAAHAAHA
jgi:hypothetical protein